MNRPLSMTLLAISAGLALAGCCEEMSKAVDVAKGGMEMYSEMQNAPQAKAAQEAGCEQAFYITPEGLKKFAKTVDPENKEAQDDAEMDSDMLSCVLVSQKELTCDDVAAAVAKNAPPTRKFALTIQRQHKHDGPLCSGLYAPDGKTLGALPKNHQNAMKNMNLGE